MEDGDEYFRDQKLTGLGGWLAFYIFGLCLTILIFFSAFALVATHHQAMIDAALSTWTITFLELLFLALAIVYLWLLRLFFLHKKVAIKYTKISLVAGVVFSIVSDPLFTKVLNSLISTGENPGTPIASGQSWSSIVSTFLIPGLWYLYFQKSRRVQLTLTE